MEYTNIIHTRRKTLYINDKCCKKYYCMARFRIPICKFFNINSSSSNKYLIKSKLDISIKLQEHININFDKFTHLYWNLSTIIIDNIPINIIYIQYKGQLNIVDYLPSNLQYLSLGCEFNHPIDNLPPNLKNLIIGRKFNHWINNLPFGLEKIWFGSEFTQCVDYLPETLIYVELPSYYPNDISNLPIGIQQIKLNITYKKSNWFETIKLLENKIIWK